MLDPLAQQVGVGGAVAIILVAVVLKFLPGFISVFKSQRNGNGSKSAGLTANEWKTAIKEEVIKALSETAAGRHQDLRKLMVDVMEQEFKQMMKEVIGEWLDNRLVKRRRSGR